MVMLVSYMKFNARVSNLLEHLQPENFSRIFQINLCVIPEEKKFYSQFLEGNAPGKREKISNSAMLRNDVAFRSPLIE